MYNKILLLFCLPTNYKKLFLFQNCSYFKILYEKYRIIKHNLLIENVYNNKKSHTKPGIIDVTLNMAFFLFFIKLNNILPGIDICLRIPMT